MKKNITCLALAMVTSNVTYSQVSFSCDYREYCDWNENNSKFENCNGYDESSLFVMT